jgi:hypothetical protein
MSIKFRCVECATVNEVADDQAGKTVLCRKCHGWNRLSSRATIANAPSGKNPVELEPGEQEPFRYDDEPWFYGYLEKYAKFLDILGYVIAAVCAILSTVWLGSTLSMAGASGVITVLVPFLGWLLSLVLIAAMICWWLSGVAAILLLVDTARNIRATKKNTAAALIQK